MENNARITSGMIDTIQRALKEDIGRGDTTTECIVPEEALMYGEIIAKQSGIISGLAVAQKTYQLLNEKVHFDIFIDEGASVRDHQKLAEVKGSARTLLTAERTALNFLGRMSGISTLTNQFVEAVLGTSARILDTRKTAPGLREFDKMAVRLGGGMNHRIGLFDMILIKDNHIDFAGSLEEAVRRVRSAGSGLEIEVETRTLEEVSTALRIGVERILLDNMSCAMMKEAVVMSRERAKLEASGNITLENVREVAETGVDYISTGALTHSVKVFDLSFKYLRAS
ncbi:MAG: carboxylating nicotinate-nucleotide diphosphorylase [Chloroflexi bacterium]|nr:carboxylating nicotinate-nucleotide diphosphorylase [Chloroflexota bacterium]